MSIQEKKELVKERIHMARIDIERFKKNIDDLEKKIDESETEEELLLAASNDVEKGLRFLRIERRD